MGRNKRRAESQFDFSAAPISVSSFLRSVEDEKFGLEFEINKPIPDNGSSEIIEVKYENAVDEILPCIMSAFLCEQEIVPNKISDLDEHDNGLSESFHQQLEQVAESLDTTVDKLIDIKVEKVTGNESVSIRNEIKSSHFNEQIFVERRLYQSLQLMKKVDKQFVKEFFPDLNESLLYDNNQFFNDNKNSRSHLFKVVQNQCESLQQCDQFVDFEIANYAKLKKDKNINFDCLFVAGYILKNAPDQLKNRHKTVIEIFPALEDFTISDRDFIFVFKQLGIEFFPCSNIFNERKQFIAQMVIGKYHQLILNNKKKRIKQDEEIVDQDLHDPGIQDALYSIMSNSSFCDNFK